MARPISNRLAIRLERGFLLPLLFLWGFGALLTGFESAARVRNAEAALWAVVRGTLIEPLDYARNRRSRGNCHVRVRYEYVVAGQAYTGMDAWPGAVSGPCDQADRLFGRYAARSSVTVYYDPRQPGRAALIPRVQTSDSLLLAGVLLLVLAAVATLDATIPGLRRHASLILREVAPRRRPDGARVPAEEERPWF